MKIRYGIDLGTTNSAIARLDGGEARILKSDTQKDTIPSCVSFDKKGETRVGDTAMNKFCLLYTSPSPRDATLSRMPSSA